MDRIKKEKKNIREDLSKKLLTSILVLSLGLFCSPAMKDAGEGETMLAFLSPGSGNSRNAEQVFTVEEENPNPSTEEPILIKEGFGANGPEVMLDFDPRSVNPYTSIRLRFSHSMDTSSVRSSILDGNVRLESEGTPLDNMVFTWTSPVTLSIRPPEALAQNKDYTIELNPSSATEKLKTATEPQENLPRHSFGFRTEPSYPTRIHVASGGSEFLFSNEQSLVLDRSSRSLSGLGLKIEFTDPGVLESIKSLTLCKLTAIETHPTTIPCTEGVATGIELCKDGNCPATIETSLSSLPSTLQPASGVSNYFYRIESFSGRYFYRTVNFVWGNLHRDESDIARPIKPESKVFNGAKLAVVQNEGARAVAGIIEAFARGEFTLKDSVDNQNKSLNGYLNSSTSLHPNNASSGVSLPSGTCMDWPTAPSGGDPAKLPAGMQYLNRVGPFCGISVTGTIFDGGSFDDVNYEAVADIYITELNLDESVWTGSEWVQNAELTINPENGYMDLTLNGKKASGRMAVVAKVTDIEFFDYLLDETLVYYTPPSGAPASNPDGEGVSFALNETNVVPRRAFARTKLETGTAGDAIISMHPFAFPEPFNPSADCLSLPDPVPFPYTFFCNPFTTEWSNHITTSSIVGSGAVAAIVGDVIEQKIPEVKPKVVQGVIGDIATKVAPDILNNILGQVKSGITVGLPGYLPDPLNKIRLTIQAQLTEDAGTKSDGTNFGLEGSAHASLKTCIPDGPGNLTGNCPWDVTYSRSAVPPTPNAPDGDSFVVHKNPSVELPTAQTRWNENPGVLLGIHEDTLNQAFYWLWRTGGLNLSINKDFIDSINQFTGGSTLLRLTNSLLKADPILTVIAPGQSNFSAVDTNGDPVQIQASDNVIIKVNPIVAPQVRFLPLSGNPGFEDPKIGINLSDLKLTVVGKKGDNYADTSDEYDMANVRISIQSVANLNLGTYSLPPCTGDNCFGFPPEVLSSVGNPSIQLEISDEEGKLFYILEVLEGDDNPLGLRPDAIYQVLEPLVRDMIVPLLNNVVRDIPIPKLRACGLDLTNVKTLPVPGDSGVPYLLIHANAGNYGFFGNCEL